MNLDRERSPRSQTAARWPAALLDTLTKLSIIALCVTLILVTVRPSLFGRRPETGVARPPALPAALPLPSEPISIDGAAVRGRRDATVAVLEYSDLQCPYCGQFARDVLPTLEKQYIERGTVLFAFRNFPLETLHPYALRAADPVECAAVEGRFWEMHDRLFADQSHLDDASLLGQARALAIQPGRFTACLGGHVEEKIRRDIASGKALGVSGTPTFFVGQTQPGGRMKAIERLTGSQPLTTFRAVLDKVAASVTKH